MNVCDQFSSFDFGVDWEALCQGHALNLFPLVIEKNC